MKIKLLKEFAFGVKTKPIGTVAEVTNGFGEDLIKKGIAKEITNVDTNEAVKQLLGKKTNKEENNVILQHNKSGEDASTKNKK